ncbi:MAG: hypothetical protein V2A74_13935, partial [bacterium]
MRRATIQSNLGGSAMKPSMNMRLCSAAILLALAMSLPAGARVKLVALPDREKLAINLDNPSNTLVTEERVVTLQEGTNTIDFSWQNVSIDSSSIQLQILGHPESTKLINVAYPPNEAALTWQVYSPKATEERIRVYYLLSGLGREFSYRGVTDKEEKKVAVENHFRFINTSGEEFENADIRLGYG